MYLKRIGLVISLIINSLSCFALFVEDTVSIENMYFYAPDQEFSVSAKVINGNGILIAKNIFIDCDKFEFTGTIVCDGLCSINARSKLDPEMFKREGEGTFEIITDFEGEFQIYQSTEQHTKRTMFQPWLVAVLNDISLTLEQKKKFLVWSKREVRDHFDNADPLCEQEDEAGKKAREKFIQGLIEHLISGLKKVGVPSKKLSLARMRINEVVRKQISEHVS